MKDISSLLVRLADEAVSDSRRTSNPTVAVGKKPTLHPSLAEQMKSCAGSSTNPFDHSTMKTRCSTIARLAFSTGISLATVSMAIIFFEEERMNKSKQIFTVALLSASVGLGTQSLFAQGAPGSGSSMPGAQDKDGSRPTVPQPGPGTPHQPTIPGQPAPGLPHTEPIPGQRGTIPERIAPPSAGHQDMAVTSEHIKKAQDALKTKGHNPGSDGKMDDKTQQALREFQKNNDLPATGVLDEKTAAKLGVNLGTGDKTTPHPNRGTSPSSKSSGSLR
jgi:hypothetical protein